MYPDPRRKIWFVRVKERFHAILEAQRNTLEFGMRNPMLSPIFSQRETLNAHVTDVVAQMEKEHQSNLCEDRVRGVQGDCDIKRHPSPRLTLLRGDSTSRTP